MIDPSAAVTDDIRPVVARRDSSRAVWAFAFAAVVAGAALFTALEARRTTITSPRVTAPAQNAAEPYITAPPPLIGPSARRAMDEPMVLPILRPPPIEAAPADLPPPTGQTQRQRIAPRSAPADTSSSTPSAAGMTAKPNPPEPSYVFRNEGASSRPEAPGPLGKSDERVRASHFVAPATTVAQGTVIQAVLETALDSNQPGFARAVVSQQVFSFDGTRVLIPRGSKLFGDYKADLGRGQNRALIQWRRLTRPDGAIINLDSPSADPLGRAGVRGKVNSHFFERFGGAILQSALDFGVQVGARKAAGDTVILAVPGGIQQISPIRSEEVRPTLTVRQGTSVTVFVARDLDFTDVEP